MEKSPSPNSPLRITLSEEERGNITLEQLLEKWKTQEEYINFLEGKKSGDNECAEKLKLQQQEATRRENVLLMRLATKEQEMQELLSQIQELKQTQAPSTSQLQTMLIDPAVNLLFEKMKTELTETKDRLDQAQNDLSAWKFTPDSVTGKKLMAKCRMLIQENQDLGKQLSQGRIAQLEAELALQRKYSDELKGSQDEMNEFVIQLDEEVEGMQATICTLQEQLKTAKLSSTKIDEENQRLRKRIEDFSKQSVTHSNKIEEQIIDTKPAIENEFMQETKEPFLDERTIHSSNGDSNMTDASEELPMEHEPSITTKQSPIISRTVDEVDSTVDSKLSNHVTVIRGTEGNKKDIESQMHAYVSPTKGFPKTSSFSITDLLASSGKEATKKETTDITMEEVGGLKSEENGSMENISALNGEIDDNAI